MAQLSPDPSRQAQSSQHQDNAEQRHDGARHPVGAPSQVLAKAYADKEQQRDGDRVGRSQRHGDVAQEHEGQRHGNGGKEDEEEDRRRAAQILGRRNGPARRRRQFSDGVSDAVQLACSKQGAFDLCPDISTEQYPLGIISAEMNCILIPPQGGRHRMLTS